MDKYEDLREAVRKHAFVQARSGALIISSERTGMRSNWIFDFRALILQPHWLDRYAEIFWERYEKKYPFQVCGMETAGIPLVAAIVMKSFARGKPVNGFYIRKSRKRKDLMKQVEGIVTDAPVIIVDDLINFGRTKHRQIKILEEAGKEVSTIFTILQFRDMSAYEFATSRNIALDSLFTLEDFGLPMIKADAPEVPRDAFDVVWHFEGIEPSFHLVVQKSAPVLDDARIFFGADTGIFYALYQETGDIAWHMQVGKYPEGKAILSTPAIHGSTVYFGAYDGNVYALDCATGEKKWVNSDADWIGASPSLAPELNLLYIGLEFGLWHKRGGIAAIDMQTGETLWRMRHSELTHGTPLYIKEEGIVVIGSNDRVMYAYDAKKGTLLWRYQTEGEIKVSPAYDQKRRLVLVAAGNGTFYALNAKNGSPAFARQIGAGLYSIPLVDRDTVYVASLDKTIYAIDLDTGKDRWAYETGGRVFGAPAIAEGSLWCGSNDGRLYEFDPKSGALRATFQATERVICKIAYDATKKYIFFRTVANEIYCIKRKQ